MKTKKEIKNLSKKYWSKQPYNEDAYFIGYTQCQEDMMKQDMIKSVCPKCACEPAIKLLGEYHCEMCGHKGW